MLWFSVLVVWVQSLFCHSLGKEEDEKDEEEEKEEDEEEEEVKDKGEVSPAPIFFLYVNFRQFFASLSLSIVFCWKWPEVSF